MSLKVYLNNWEHCYKLVLRAASCEWGEGGLQNKITKWLPCHLWSVCCLVHYSKMVSNLLLLRISPLRIFSSLLEKRMDLIMWLHIEWLEMSYCLSKQRKCSRWLKMKLFSLTCCIFDWLAGQLFDRRAYNISSLLQVGLKFSKNDRCWQNGFTNQTCTIRATKMHYAFLFQ